MLPRIEETQPRAIVRNYGAADVMQARVVAWDREGSRRFPSLSPGVRPLRADDTLADVAGVAHERIERLADAERPGRAYASTITSGGFAWCEFTGDVRAAETSWMRLESMTDGAELTIDFATGKVRSRADGEPLFGFAIYVVQGTTNVCVRLAQTFPELQ
ncbi:MAG: hypothetical protein JWP97_5405 [Labilithrix sp.]|nr:hypothetical protein [Labilithrix sp.]